MTRRLKTPSDCRRHLAFIINQVQAGAMDPAKAGKIGYLLNILIRCMEVQHQQDKVERLAERLDEMEEGLG
jgi:hypothetical protein